MAKLEQGILGHFSGKVGTVVGYRWRGMECVRAYRREINYPDTPLQQTEREWFVAMVRFAAHARQALLLGFASQAAEAQMTEGNWFVKCNKMNFRHQGQGVVTDYAHLRLASGSAAPVSFKAPVVTADGVLCVDFEKNTQFSRALPDDRVYLYAYCPTLETGMLTAPTARRTKQLRVSLPDSWRGHEVHLWGFVIDREGRASNSSYVGSTLNGTESEDPLEIKEQNRLYFNDIEKEESTSEGPLPDPLPHLRT